MDYQIDVLLTSKLLYLWVFPRIQHAWVVCTQASGAFRSKSPSVRLSPRVQICTQAHVPAVPFARRASLINIAFPILCHSTPVREAHIDRQSSFAWSIASFSAPLSFWQCPSLQPSRSASVFPQSSSRKSCCHNHGTPRSIFSFDFIFRSITLQSHKVEAGSHVTVDYCIWLYITGVLSAKCSTCPLPSICTGIRSQQQCNMRPGKATGSHEIIYVPLVRIQKQCNIACTIMNSV